MTMDYMTVTRKQPTHVRLLFIHLFHAFGFRRELPSGTLQDKAYMTTVLIRTIHLKES